MKVLTTKQIYESDQATMHNKSISSIDLMENAALQCFNWINRRIKNNNNIVYVFCGIGNNGGDGLVIARKLLETNYKVKTYIVNFGKERSNDFNVNYDRLMKIKHKPIEISAESELPEIERNSIIIDAIFGIGLTRPPQGFVKKIIQKLNELETDIISIDFPSGLFSERSVTDKESVIKASYTLTFQNPKLAFFLPENQSYLGKWVVLDIGLDQDFIKSINTKYKMICDKHIKAIYKKRNKFSHKGIFGHSLIIGGSFGKIGAVVLASKAALKVGSGLVTTYIPKCGYSILQAANPEVMVEVDDEKYIQYFNYKTKPDVIGIGVGIGTHLKTINGFAKFLKNNKVPLVIDADALNIFSKHKELLNYLPENSILTPHLKEFERLVGKWFDDYEKLEMLLEFSTLNKCIVVLKGANSAIAYQNKIYFNATGNPALATAGSGDVLTGIITGLVAQNYKPFNAAILGVYLHGLAADIAINKNLTMETFIASDCIDFLSDAFKTIS